MMRLIVVFLVVVAVLTGVALFVLVQADKSRSEMPVLGQVRNFELMDHTGEPFTVADFKDRLTIVDFIFTRCKGPCPIMGAWMSELYDLYEGYEHIQFVSISVEPEYDTPEVLREYAEDLGVTDGRWLFLRGPIDTVKRICEEEFMLSADDLPGAHSTKFVLVDQQAQIRGYYSGTDEASINVLKSHIKELSGRLF